MKTFFQQKISQVIIAVAFAINLVLGIYCFTLGVSPWLFIFNIVMLWIGQIFIYERK